MNVMQRAAAIGRLQEMADQRLIDANALRADWLENGENEYVYDTNSFLSSIDDAPTIDHESLPIVQQLREALSKAVAEKEAAEALLAEYSGVDGCKTIKTCFGYPLDEVQRLVEADKAAKLQRAVKRR